MCWVGFLYSVHIFMYYTQVGKLCVIRCVFISIASIFYVVLYHTLLAYSMRTMPFIVSVLYIWNYKSMIKGRKQLLTVLLFCRTNSSSIFLGNLYDSFLFRNFQKQKKNTRLSTVVVFRSLRQKCSRLSNVLHQNNEWQWINGCALFLRRTHISAGLLLRFMGLVNTCFVPNQTLILVKLTFSLNLGKWALCAVHILVKIIV